MQDRIKLLRKELNLTQEKFGERLGMKKNSISQIENGVNSLTEQLLVSICREFSVNEKWLRTGEGEMFATLNRTQQIAQFTADLFKGEKDSFKERFLLALSKLDENEWKVLEKIANDLVKEKD
ncbi:helix-turn-helix domain-containing protein [Faecalimonas sp.]